MACLVPTLKHLYRVLVLLLPLAIIPLLPPGSLRYRLSKFLSSFPQLSTTTASKSMAWSCSGSTNSELVDNLFNAGIIKSDRIRNAMRTTDRKFYVRNGHGAYKDSPQPIGFQATISAPHMHAHALEYMLPNLKPGASVLDVGCGSGYLVGILHELVQPGGKVVGIDHIKGLTDLSISNLSADKHKEKLFSKEIQIVTGDGRQGYDLSAPYDVIHVGAASPDFPEKLIEQLKEGGIMFVPVGTYMQDVWLIKKDEKGKVDKKKFI